MKKIFFMSLAMCLMLVAVPVSAKDVARPEATTATGVENDTAGNTFLAGDSVSTTLLRGKPVENELFMAGRDVYCDGTAVDGSAFIAGQNVQITDTTVNGTSFVAGQIVSVNATSNHNNFVAGQSISLGHNNQAKSVYAVGQIISIDGTYDYVAAAGTSVSLNATVNGDVSLVGDDIYIGPNANITGKVSITYGQSVDIAEGIDSSKFEIVKEVTEADKNEEVSNKSKVALVFAKLIKSIVKKIKNAIMLLFANSIIALLMAFMFRKNLKDAYDTCKAKPGAYLGLGALAYIATPMVLVILAVTIIGARAAAICGVFYGLAIALASVFTFASFVREWFFARMKKRLNPVLEIVLAVLPYAILKQIPIVGLLIGIACCVYTFGYIVDQAGKKLKENKA